MTTEAVERAMIRRMLSNKPWTFMELSGVAERAGGTDRNADGIMQRWRKKGWATFTRADGRVWWSCTDAGRAANVSP